MTTSTKRDQTLDPRRELGEFVRTHRERLAPAAIGLAEGKRRRTPGLRREEVAQLCGLSTTWYTWIEQGRDVSASSAALARLADVLRLGRAERAYLFELAGKRDPDAATGESDPSPAILKCLETIVSPAYILDRAWNALAWNKQAERVFAGWLDADDERNLLRFIFLKPAARKLICDWEHRARRVAAEFRAVAGTRVNDAALRALIASLRQDSAEFRRFWDQHEVLAREGGERTFNHPIDGFLRFEQVTFNLADQSDFKLTILIEKDEPARGKTGKPRARRARAIRQPKRRPRVQKRK
jgi:transcriptional regulator with XRE-family HTH domain